MAEFSLASIAPRLAAARDAYEAEAAEIRAERRRLNQLELHKRLLVDHRDLQLCRSQAAGRMSRSKRASWIAARVRKHQEAKLELAAVLSERARLEARAQRLGV